MFARLVLKMRTRSAVRVRAQRSTSALFTTKNAPDTNADAAVSASMLEKFLRKCGLSKKKLHEDLYPLNFGQSARAGDFPIAVATSGGADSMALMLLLREYLQENGIKTPLLAVTVDHQLRPESGKEAQEIAKICANRTGIRHVIKVCEWQHDDAEEAGKKHTMDLLCPERPRDSKMEEQARKYRYNLLRQVCREYRVRCLFVAHNRGDQLETTLFRLGRASGINGLAGMASQLPFLSLDALPPGSEDLRASNIVTLVRPLLSVTKDQLMATCGRFQQTWIHDPSNDNSVYDRVRIRQELKRIEKEAPATLVLFSRFQQTAEKAKNEFARVERSMLRKYTVIWESQLVVMRMAITNDPKMFNELLHRLLSLIVLHVGNKEAPPRLASVIRLAKDLHRLDTGKQLTLGGCRIRLVASGRCLEFQPERKKQ